MVMLNDSDGDSNKNTNDNDSNSNDDNNNNNIFFLISSFFINYLNYIFHKLFTIQQFATVHWCNF